MLRFLTLTNLLVLAGSVGATYSIIRDGEPEGASLTFCAAIIGYAVSLAIASQRDELIEFLALKKKKNGEAP